MHRIARWTANCIIIAVCLLLPMGHVGATETTQSVPRINEVYPNAPGSSELGFEFIELYNPSVTSIDLSAFQIRIKDKSKVMQLSGQIDPGGYASITTTFSLVNSGETVQLWLIDGLNEALVEEVAFTSGALETESWSWFETDWELAPVSSGLINTKYPEEEPPTVDICPATPAIDANIPEGYYINEDGVCAVIPPVTEHVLCDVAIRVNEIYSDPIGLESAGGEYVELFNAGNEALLLSGCEIRSSKSSQLLIDFTDQDIIGPHEFILIELVDRLTNANGSVTLSGYDREDVTAYSGVTEGVSVSFFETGWELSNQPTPSSQNIHSAEVPEETGSSVASLADCGEGKYRSPETNRCRNIVSASAGLSECDPGQYRSPETNRCRKISTASASIAACAPGQERNPETNRCRKISSTNSSLKPCQEGYERNPETNRCRKVSNLSNTAQLPPEDRQSTATSINTVIMLTAVSLAGGYAVYEYRTEIGSVLQKVKAAFIKGRPPD